ncbi:MAG: hypothetical protein ACHQVK_03435 [Candidatus Paceibacterales bacterium]
MSHEPGIFAKATAGAVDLTGGSSNNLLKDLRQIVDSKAVQYTAVDFLTSMDF